MTDDRKHHLAGITRRSLLRNAGIAGAVAAVGVIDVMATPALAEAPMEQARTGLSEVEAYEHFTADEAELLEAIADHLIPSDDEGPGALEARAVRYIDRALGGALADSLDAYRSGLAAFDRYCWSSRDGSFMGLSEIDRTSALIDIETGAVTGAVSGFVWNSSAFFKMVRSHVIQGTFSDPFYGGNANFVGWDLINYPGVRTAVTESDQRRLEADDLRSYRRSAYEWDQFNKAKVSTVRGRDAD